MRTILAVVASGVLAASAVLTAAPASAAVPDLDLPEAGVFLEGIGVDDDAGLVYVSATNRSGTIYRAKVGDDRLEVWQGPTPGDNGRGIDVDDAGRVFVAGGPSAEVRVFSRSGRLLAELPTGEAGSFLNDVRVADDGSVYVTDSSLPRIWRVFRSGGTWQIELWRDVSGTIAYTPALTDFDLGGIVTTPDGKALLTTQGTTGQLWRIELRSRAISEVPVDGAPLVNADGIVLAGRSLYVVQNFSRQITRLELHDRWRTATTEAVVATPADRTFTTAKRVGGRLLLVDSKFGFAPAQAVAEDRVVSFRRF
ncbi:gluconolaconase [Kineosporia sp. A_224]|uniref:gluconolaconase n=1 Tax=Kineosporia sp. A_224 TaxID=1962180 RepID=UPI00117B03C2|nr:gluconolaconase [Kineosporia sp. A_224]